MRHGEQDLISKINRCIRTDTRVRLGIGDDAAVLRNSGGKDLLFTTDMLIEGRHFDLRKASPYEIGRKALAVNLSDIAAMGGVPLHAVLALGLPKKRLGIFVQQLICGVHDLAKQFHVNWVGGDSNASDKLILSVALLGEVEQGRAFSRSGAKVGDTIYVSGALGGSYLSKKHLNFTPRLKEARWLLKNTHVHAMMDISDGLAMDMHRLSRASAVGAVLEEARIPLAQQARNVHQALTEGEDFELLFTAAPGEYKKLSKKFYQVGRIVPRARGVSLLKKDGTKIPLSGGFDHFR